VFASGEKNMKKTLSFAEVLEAADKLSPDEQQTIIDILYRRMIYYRRKELVKEVHEAQQEYQEGRCRPATSEEILKELLS
jgi:hypothetical protein